MKYIVSGIVAFLIAFVVGSQILREIVGLIELSWFIAIAMPVPIALLLQAFTRTSMTWYNHAGIVATIYAGVLSAGLLEIGLSVESLRNPENDTVPLAILAICLAYASIASASYVTTNFVYSIISPKMRRINE